MNDDTNYREPAATEESFPDRSADEKAIIEAQFRAGGYSSQPYIAPPAKGHDVVGLWHYFPAHTRAGYAAHAIATHRMLLDELKVPTSLVPHRMAAIDIDSFPPDRAEMLTKWLADAVGKPEAIIVSLPPDVGMYDMARALVNYVAGPECTKVSPYAAQLVGSDKITQLWCVSPFAARAYLNADENLKSKVFVVRPPVCDGIWRDMFKPIDAIERPDRDTFVFGTLGTWHERKGFHDLIRAYFSSFRRDQPVALHIRTSSMDSSLTIKKFEEKVLGEIRKIAEEEFGDPDYPNSKKQPKIKLLTGTALSEQEVIDWLGSLNCYVNPSYGEGLGIPPIWALAQGVPLVTSDFGAVGELEYPTAHPFKHKLVRVPESMRGHSPIWGEDSYWGGYEVEALAAEMRSAAAVDVPMKADARVIRERFSYTACRPWLVQALKNLCRSEALTKWGLD